MGEEGPDGRGREPLREVGRAKLREDERGWYVF